MCTEGNYDKSVGWLLDLIWFMWFCVKKIVSSVEHQKISDQQTDLLWFVIDDQNVVSNSNFELICLFIFSTWIVFIVLIFTPENLPRHL